MKEEWAVFYVGWKSSWEGGPVIARVENSYGQPAIHVDYRNDFEEGGPPMEVNMSEETLEIMTKGEYVKWKLKQNG
jgi:hypothetical protein